MRTLVCLTLLAVSGSAQSEPKLAGGPYTVRVGPKQATIVYLIESWQVKLGLNPSRLEQTGPVLRAEKVNYTGLTPGKTYYYDVLGRDEGRGSFKTPPAGPADVRFVVYGDTRSRHELHQRVVDAIVKSDPDFVIHTGDLVSDGADSGQWPTFFRIEKELLRKAAFFPVLGNHERNNRQYYEFFDVAHPYYSFDWGQAHFTLLNSDFGNAAPTRELKDQFWAEQVRWMEEDLQNSQKAAYRFVISHHPPFTAVGRRQNDDHPIKKLVPLFEKYKVAAVFNGHDHNYQHHVVNGVHYVVTGGGGAPLYPTDAPMPEITRKVESVEHFVIVRMGEGKVILEAVATDGRVVDSFEL